MTQPSNQELERLFAAHGIPKHRLYPWWYRLYRRVGLEPRPPVLFTLTDHFRYGGIAGALVFVVGCLIMWQHLTTPLQALVIPLFVIVILIPLWNWWYYRRIRRRIGL